MLSLYSNRGLKLKPPHHLAAAQMPADVVWMDLINPTPEETAFVERTAKLAMPGRTELSEIESSSRLNRWLDNMAADPAPLSPEKVVKDKPADAVDTCWDLSGNKIVEPATTNPNTQCNRVYPYFSQPQIEAGQASTRDVLKCTLKSIDFRDYSVAFTAPEQSQLRSIFPNGVCDYTQPGIGQQPLLGTYLLVQ